MILPPYELQHRASSLLQASKTAGMDGESEPLYQIRESRPVLLHASRSTPGFSRQLTAKLSFALVHNETVIHRPQIRSRPTTQNTNLEPRMDEQRHTTLPQLAQSDVSSFPSSFLSSGNAPLSQSTAPTSFVSSGAPHSAETTHRLQNGFIARHNRDSPPRLLDQPANSSNIQYLVFPRQDAPMLCKPSIATIEKAAAVKIFLESHFNQVLAIKDSPRSIRRRQLERKLFALALPNEQRQYQRRE